MEDAVAYICWEAEGLRHHLEGAFSSKNLLQDDCKYGGKVYEAIRDCGWYIYFQHGDAGLVELTEAIVANIFKLQRYEIEHIIEHSLLGIGP
jgi:hypothetical protein